MDNQREVNFCFRWIMREEKKEIEQTRSGMRVKKIKMKKRKKGDPGPWMVGN